MDMSGALLNFHEIPGCKRVNTEIDALVGEIAAFDYAVLDAVYSQVEFDTISCEFIRMRRLYIETFGQRWFKEVDENNAICLIFTFDGEVFIGIALKRGKLVLVRELIRSAIPAISPHSTATGLMSSQTS